jgi:hypothetical protein
MKEIALLENDPGLNVVPDFAVSHVEDLRPVSLSPVPSLVPSLDLFSSTAAPVSPTQVVGSLLDFEGKEEVLLPCKMISRPAATRIYHLDKYNMMRFHPMTA